MGYRLYSNHNNEPYPAPFLEVAITSKVSGQFMTIQMKIDTGSSITVLPLSIIEKKLGVNKPLTLTSCTSYVGVSTQQPTYLFDFKIDGNTFTNIKTIGVDKKDDTGLIGRDILSKFFLKCDGPNQKFEMEYIPI